MLNNFIYAKTKALFLKELEAGNVLDEAIVFIEDTKEIWNHGTYFDGKPVDVSNIEESIQNIINNKAEKSELPTKTSDLTNDSGFITIEDVPTGSLLKAYTFLIDDIVRAHLEYTITQEELEKIQNADIVYISDGTKNIQLTVKEDTDHIDFYGYDLNLYPYTVNIFSISVFTSLKVTIGLEPVGLSDYISDYIGETQASFAIATCEEIVDGASIEVVENLEIVELWLDNPRPITLILTDSYDNIVCLIGPYAQLLENALIFKFIGEYNDLTIECVSDVSKYGILHIKPKSEGGSSDANVQAVDTTETLDDVETNTYVKYVAQTLTDALKLQVRENIGVNSSNNIDLTNYVKKEELSNYHTKSEIDALLGDINTILESIING